MHQQGGGDQAQPQASLQGQRDDSTGSLVGVLQMLQDALSPAWSHLDCLTHSFVLAAMSQAPWGML